MLTELENGPLESDKKSTRVTLKFGSDHEETLLSADNLIHIFILKHTPQEGLLTNCMSSAVIRAFPGTRVGKRTYITVRNKLICHQANLPSLTCLPICLIL
jgi:hypothetical protein